MPWCAQDQMFHSHLMLVADTKVTLDWFIGLLSRIYSSTSGEELFLVYGGDEEILAKGYTDASFMTDHDDFKSQSGYVFTLNGGAVSWKSFKQKTVADSTTEAEYIAASEAAKEGIWIMNFIIELDVVPSAKDPLELYCDNTGAVAQAKEPRAH